MATILGLDEGNSAWKYSAKGQSIHTDSHLAQEVDDNPCASPFFSYKHGPYRIISAFKTGDTGT